MNTCGIHAKQWDWWYIVQTLSLDDSGQPWERLEQARKECAEDLSKRPAEINGEILADWLERRSNAVLS